MKIVNRIVNKLVLQVGEYLEIYDHVDGVHKRYLITHAGLLNLESLRVEFLEGALESIAEIITHQHDVTLHVPAERVSLQLS